MFFLAVGLAPFSASAQTQPVFPVLKFEQYAVASPLAAAEGDINSDGVVDTLYASAGSTPNTSILTASPRSSSGARQPAIVAGTVPCVANSLALADLNRDNKLDAILTCKEGLVVILPGNGNGTFGAATTYSVASAAIAVAADLNADGYPELVVGIASGTSASTFAILLNTASAGPPAFAQPKIYGGAVGSRQVLIGDLNHDGKPDVVAGGTPGVVNGSIPAVFYGNGDGTLQAATFLPGFGPATALADFNGDGRTDTADVFANFGEPFINSVQISFPGENQPFTLTEVFPGSGGINAIDVNGDGHPDVVLTGSTTTILLNDGTGNLTVGHSYATPGDFYTVVHGAAGNDLVFTTPRGFYTLHGDGKGSFDGLPSFYRSNEAATADLNGDGVTDLLTIEPTTGLANTDIGRGDGSFILIPHNLGSHEAFPVLADFNGDGILDLVDIATDPSTGGSSYVLFQKGASDGSFSFFPSPSFDLGVTNATGVVAGDFNSDGKQDLVVSEFDTSSGSGVSRLVLLLGNGDGTFAAQTTTLAAQAANATTPASLLTADLNRDGKLDFIWRNTAYISNGSATPTPLPLSVQGNPLAVADVNGDGIADLVIDNAIYAGNGDGTFQPHPFATIPVPTGATLVSAVIGDVNGDGNGNPDIVLQYMADMAGVTVAFGDGHGVFTIDSNTYITGAKTPDHAVLTRLNNSAPAPSSDNRLDYLVFADGAAISLLNQSNPAPPPPLLLPTTLTVSLGRASAFDPVIPAPLQPVNLQAQVAAVNPTGIVTFTAPDGTVLGKSAITNGGTVASALYTYPVEGTYTVFASYPGDSINAPTTSAPASITVAKYSTVLAVKEFGPVYTGRTITFNTSINAYNPTALITLSSGATQLATVSANAGTGDVIGQMFPVSVIFPAAGTYSLSASYPGDASNLPATSPPQTITVVDGVDFSISSKPTTITVSAGDTATYAISLTSLLGFFGYVTITCQPACIGGQIYVPNGGTVTTPISVQTSSTSNGTGGPAIRYAPIGAAFLLFGFRRKYLKNLRPQLQFGLFALLLSLGAVSLSGCSSPNNSSSPVATTPKTYSIVITGTDDSGVISHSVNLQLIVQ